MIIKPIDFLTFSLPSPSLLLTFPNAFHGGPHRFRFYFGNARPRFYRRVNDFLIPIRDWRGLQQTLQTRRANSIVHLSDRPCLYRNLNWQTKRPIIRERSQQRSQSSAMWSATMKSHWKYWYLLRIIPAGPRPGPISAVTVKFYGNIDTAAK